MSELTPKQVHEMAEVAGLVLDDARARTIASRLSGVLDELAKISDAELWEVEPAPSFIPRREWADG